MGAAVSAGSSLRSEQQDQLAEVAYAQIRGPGTVGIETNGSLEEGLSTTLQALDYFGVYSISRAIPTPAALEANVPAAFHEEDRNNENLNTSNLSEDWGLEHAHKPVASKEIISSRRFSIGVYGLYTKM
jgi:hypothetical protein